MQVPTPSLLSVIASASASAAIDVVRRKAHVLGVVVLCMGAIVRPVRAATTFNVKTVAELRAAVVSVNGGAGGDKIVLAPGVYNLSTGDLPTLQQDVTIQGDPSAATVLVGGTFSSWIFAIRATNFSIENLTLQKTNYGITYEGRGVFSATGLTITESRVGFDAGDSGGVVYLTNSTIANNTGTGVSVSCGELHMTNVTVSNNNVGLDSNCGQRMNVTNSLIVANRRDCGFFASTILKALASLDSDGSCKTRAIALGGGFTTTSTPGLSPLANNGGPTMTQAIAATSPAFKAGNLASCPAKDQRGFFRRPGPFCDIGAYQLGAKPALGNTPIGSNVSVSPAPGVTLTFSSVTTAGDTVAPTGGPPPPTGFKSDGLVYDISTTAVFAGSVQVCLPYNPSGFVAPQLPAVYHYEIIPPLPGQFWVNRTTSVDAVNHIVCATVTSLSPFAVFVTIPFASFKARVEIDRQLEDDVPAGDSFEVEGRGVLGQTSDGVVPDTETVTLSLGALSLTIPPGSFVKTIDKDEHRGRHDRDRNRERDDDDVRITYRFRGMIAGVWLKAEIEQGPKHAFRFRFEGWQANFGLTVNPVTVGLVIGDDVGQVVVRAGIEE